LISQKFFQSKFLYKSLSLPDIFEDVLIERELDFDDVDELLVGISRLSPALL
jgi:hypothetical protein